MRAAVYAMAMVVVGVVALVITYLVTGSIWWALLALLLAGPAVQILVSPRARPRRR